MHNSDVLKISKRSNLWLLVAIKNRRIRVKSPQVHWNSLSTNNAYLVIDSIVPWLKQTYHTYEIK